MVRTHEPGFGGGTSLGDYEIIMKCGAGTYGSVYRAVHKGTRRVVALKKVVKFPMEDGFPVECKYLEQLCSSRNIIHMLDYFYTLEGELVLVFEYMETDLWKIISGPHANVPVLQMKCIMKQLFEGLNQCHTAGIMHRDVKPSNLLFNAAGVLKLADFGLTTSFVKPPYLSSNVVSLYYRPPELLMGSHDYGPEIDIWSAGCILIELLTNDYLFAGSNETDQLNMIFKVFGTPDERMWPGITTLPGWGLVESGKQHPVRDLFENYQNVDSNALDLASRLLQLDPKKRISSFEALNHPWFSSTPLPCLPSHLPILWKDKKQISKSRPVANPPPLPPHLLPNNDQFYSSQNQYQNQLPSQNHNQYPPPQYNDNIQMQDDNNNYNNNNNTNNYGFDNFNQQQNYNNFENNLYQNYYNMNNAFTFAMQFNYNLYNNNTTFYQPNLFNQNSAEYYNYYTNQNNFFNNNNFQDQYNNYYNNYYNANANLNATNTYHSNTNFNNNNFNNNTNNYQKPSTGYINNNCGKAFNQYDGRTGGYGKAGPSRKGIPLNAVR